MKTDIDTNGWVVLLIDDEPDNLTVVSKVLTMQGVKTVAAEDGKTGLKLANEEKPTIVLLDISMPVMNGFAVLEKLREQSSFDQVPIIALTALAMPGERERIKEAGFDGYISKPFDIFELIPAINRSLIAIRQQSSEGDEQS